MDFLKFDAAKCTLCGKCIDKCPFGALSIEAKGIAVGDACRMCGMCVRSCPEGAIRFEQRANTVDKSKWSDFLVYVEQERGDIHPVAFEMIGEARKMARKTKASTTICSNIRNTQNPETTKVLKFRRFCSVEITKKLPNGVELNSLSEPKKNAPIYLKNF